MFVFCVCQIGSEKLLKAEVARDWPAWRLAFSRPGYVTFKTDLQDPTCVLALNWHPVFARRLGLSLGPTPDDRLPAPQVRGAIRLLQTHAQGRPLRLHVFPMGPSHDGFPCPLCLSVHDRIAAHAPASGVRLLPEPDPQEGDLVADVACAEEGPWWIGLHRHAPRVSPWPGANLPLTLPSSAPSRAWLKVEEAVRWSGLPLTSGQTALEVGCAPGGASMALLQRGIDVIGVDPGQIDPRVLGHDPLIARFTWIRRRMQDLSRHDLPSPIDWLLFDVNAGPNVVLPYVERLLSWARPSLRGLLWTVKLNSDSAADRLPRLMDQLRATGLVDVRCGQLSCHHREVLIRGHVPNRPER